MIEYEPTARTVTAGLEPVELSAAILLYGHERPSYARLHRVEQVEGQPVIAADGHALTVEALMAACTALSGSSKVRFIDPNTLALGEGVCVWWRAPAMARVRLRCQELGGERRGTVPMPGLVFAYVGTTLLIVALKGAARPTKDSALFVAPLFNHYESGQVCTGSMQLAAGMAPAAVEQAYWGSWFTQPNARRRHTLHGDGIYALWRDLFNGRWQRFPEATLAPFPEAKTLGDFLEGLTT